VVEAARADLDCAQVEPLAGGGVIDPMLELGLGQEPPLDRFVFVGTPEEVAGHAQRVLDARGSGWS